MKAPRCGSTAKAWTLVRMPERTRKVPTIDIEKATTREHDRPGAKAVAGGEHGHAEWSRAVAASQGISEAFSTGSQNHQPPQPSS